MTDLQQIMGLSPGGVGGKSVMRAIWGNAPEYIILGCPKQGKVARL